MKRYFSLYISVGLLVLLVACNNEQKLTTGQSAGVQLTAAPTEIASPITTATFDPELPPGPVPSGEIMPPPVPTFVGTLIPPSTPTQVAPESKVQADLKAAMATEPKHVEFFVVLVAQPSFDNRLLDEMSNEERATYTQREVEAFNKRTQPPVEAAILKLQQSGEVYSYHSKVAPNSFYVNGTSVAVKELSLRDDVAQLNLNHKMRMSDPTPHSSTNSPQRTESTGSIRWNIDLVITKRY